MSQYTQYKGKKIPVPIHYSLPKGINSVEAGLLVDGILEDEDLLSIFYDWERQGIIKFEKQDEKMTIIKNKSLPEDAREYEKYIYDHFFSNGKFNLLEARILVMDHCFKKGWIENYIPDLKSIYNSRASVTLGIFFLLPFFITLIILVLFLIIFLIEGSISSNGPIHLGNLAFLLFVFQYLTAKFISWLIYINKIKNLRVCNTTSGSTFVPNLLGYKRYLDQINRDYKNGSTEDDIMIKYGIAGHNVALKTNNSPYTIKMLKKCAYNDARFLGTYLKKYNN